MYKKKRIILLIITIAAIILAMSGINRPHMSPFTNKVKVENVLTGAYLENGGVIIDNQGQRLLFVDGNSKLTKVIDLSKSGSDVNYITQLAVSGDRIYATGYSCFNDGINIEHESVVCYSLGGKYLGELYRVNYSADSYIVENRFKMIAVSEDRIILSKAKDTTLTAISFDFDGKDRKKIAEETAPEHINNCMYSSINNSFTVLGRSGKTYWIDCETSACEEKNIVENNNKAPQNVKYGGLFQLYTILYWVSIAWVVLASVYAFIWLLKNKLQGKGGLCVVIALILLTSIFYTSTQAIATRDQYRQTLKSDARLIATVLSQICGDRIDGIQNMNEERVDSINKTLYEMFKSYGVDSSYYCNLYCVEDDGSIYTCVDSRNKLITGIRVGATDEMKKLLRESSEEGVYILENRYASDLFSLQRITNSKGETVAIVNIGCKISNIFDEIISDALTTFVNLLALFILIYVCYFSFSTFKEDIKRFKSREKSDRTNKMVDLAGIFVFIYFVASSIDAAIVVYVAQSLCTDISAGKQALLISLPLAAASAGCWVGNFLYNSLSQKFGERTLAVISSAVGIASLLLSVIAVKNTSIYTYVVAKLLFGFAYWGIVQLLSDSLPYNAEDNETRDAAFQSCQQAGVAATILAMLMGGYISEYLSYSMIYIIDAAVAVVLLVMSLIVFTNHNRIKKSDRKQSKSKSGWGLFARKNMLTFLVLYMAPTVFVLGYADYIFPLYSSQAGVSTLMLSNIAVFASTISLLASEWIYTLSEELDRKLVMIGSTALFCLCFVMFLVSPNIYWAIAVLFITETLTLAIETPVKIEVAEMSEEDGYDAKITQPIYYTIESGIYVAQSPVISAFLSFGYNLGTALLGLTCAGIVGVYGLVKGIFKK